MVLRDYFVLPEMAQDSLTLDMYK